jgi:hypothetical protein
MDRDDAFHVSKSRGAWAERTGLRLVIEIKRISASESFGPMLRESYSS